MNKCVPLTDQDKKGFGMGELKFYFKMDLSNPESVRRAAEAAAE